MGDDVERMVAEAEKYKSEDEAYKGKVEAKNALEGYVFNIRNTLQDENVGGKLDSADKEKITKIVEETIAWMDSTHEVQEKSVYEAKQKEVEAVVNPVMTKMYQQAGGAGGAPGAGEPKVEDID